MPWQNSRSVPCRPGSVQNIFTDAQSGRKDAFCRKKFRRRGIKSRQFVAKPGEIWYTLSWIIINKIKRSGAALPARNGRSIKRWKNVTSRAVRAAMRLMTGTESHQGVAAFASEIEYATVEDLLAAAKAKGEPPFLVLSDGIEDPHNLGAVMRSALLCGAHGIVIPKRGGASVTPTVIKSSAGAAERLPVARVANIGETIRRLKEQGVFVYCADMDGVSLRKNNLTGPIALVLGSEGSGVSQLVKKLCDGVVRLDMAAPGTGVDSYNVSVAAGIILYEIQSQRAVEE